MQKKIIALAVAALASTAAFAQTNVTVYGVVDAGVAHVTASGLKGTNFVESGMLAGSRIGFKGVEDLGNGLKALFTLEYALSVDDNSPVGVADTPWSSTVARQQFVGLTGNFGTAVVGRLQTAGYDWACAYNPLAGSAIDTVGKLAASTLLTCGSAGRANNALAYISPSFGGVTVALNHARVSESAFANATLKDNTADLVSVSYANGPLAVGGIYSKIFKSATAAADNVREFGLGASYDFKVVKLFATYQNQKDQSVVGSEGSDSKYSLSVAAPVSAAGTVIASAARNKLKNNVTANDSTTAWNVSYLHALSKRTTAYAGYTHLSNQSGAQLGAAGAAMVPTLDGNASVLGLGINHKF